LLQTGQPAEGIQRTWQQEPLLTTWFPFLGGTSCGTEQCREYVEEQSVEQFRNRSQECFSQLDVGKMKFSGVLAHSEDQCCRETHLFPLFEFLIIVFDVTSDGK
jgi:hypothetical protein